MLREKILIYLRERYWRHPRLRVSDDIIRDDCATHRFLSYGFNPHQGYSFLENIVISIGIAIGFCPNFQVLIGTVIGDEIS
jgi:hypothetical protein